MPKETMQWEKGKVPTTKPAETSPSTIVPVPSKPAQSAAATAPPKISIAAFLDAPLSLDRHPMDVGNCRLVEHWDTGFCYVYSHGLGKKISAPTDARCTERDELRKRMRQAIAEHYCD
jgi:hypothetical protein